MPNWMADPNTCVARMKKSEGGCIILAGRNEVLSRSTRVYRTVEKVPAGRGKTQEVTTWKSGHIEVFREGDDQRKDNGKANLKLRYHLTANSATVLGPMLPTEATLMSDILRAAAVNAGGSACGGQTILELMWDELMAVYERLMTGQAAEDGRDPGRAEGIAYAIAVIQNPYIPNVDSVREQAAERWEAEG